jgi:hypothetical protein
LEASRKGCGFGTYACSWHPPGKPSGWKRAGKVVDLELHVGIIHVGAELQVGSEPERLWIWNNSSASST